MALNLLAERRVNEALLQFYDAASSGEDPDRCAAGRWTCRMLLGQFEQAWTESDAIAARSAPEGAPLWNGQDFDGKRVVIRCLHGYGDAIQFLRYVPLMRKTARYVIVETHPEMVSILSCLPGADRVITWTQEKLSRDDWDVQIEVTELPWAFRTCVSTIPTNIPYLTIPPALAHRSLVRLNPDRPKLGLMWASSGWNPLRTMNAGELIPIVQRFPGLSFHSFQRGPQRDQIADLAAVGNIHDTGNHSFDILDTAADLLNLDLLITVDTMLAHLAGALGVNVWIMLPWDADWRWMLNREDTPWYPTMHLFRQPSPGDWGQVVARIGDELTRLFPHETASCETER